MGSLSLKPLLDDVRATAPLVHCITNYVTANDCANALLAIGGSPIMSDEPDDVADIAALCGGVVLNIGTLNRRSIAGMHVAAARATELGRPIVLDPVGAGASALRTGTAGALLDGFSVGVIRANMSEAKALAGIATSTRGVDACPGDAATEKTLARSASFARELASRTHAAVAITGAIDLVADGGRVLAIRNGHPLMGRITGAGCMLSCLVGAFVAANEGARLEAVAAAVAAMGLAGQIAAGRMGSLDGNGSFRMYLLDALFNLDGAALDAGALVEDLS